MPLNLLLTQKISNLRLVPVAQALLELSISAYKNGTSEYMSGDGPRLATNPLSA